MKKMISIWSVIALFFLLPVLSQAQTIVKSYRTSIPDVNLKVDVWVDNDEGIYYQGDNITIYFEANSDCYLAIYSVDTKGEVNLLYPEDRWDDGFIKGNRVYSIPGRGDDYDLVVSGPEGIEHIQAVASLERMEIPNWFDGAGFYMSDRDDPEDFIDELNYRYFDCRFGDCVKAYDGTSIYVKSPQYYYKPVYVPDYWYDTPDYSVVYIDYPYGGEVYIDGVYFGIAPLWVPRVVWGWHWFTIYDRYGYCWENRIDLYDNRTFYINNTTVRTSRSKVSRYKDIRRQAKKYRKSDYLLSEKRVKSVRNTAFDKKAGRFSRPGTTKYQQDYTGKSTSKKYKSKSYKSKENFSRKTDNRWDRWNSKKSGSDRSVDSRRYKSKKSSLSTKRSTSKSTYKNSTKAKKQSKATKSKATFKRGSKSSSQERKQPTYRNGSSHKSSKSSSKSSSNYQKSGSTKKSSSSQSAGRSKKRR